MRPDWRQSAERSCEPMSEESRDALLHSVRQITDAPQAEGREAEFGSKEADAVVFTQKVPIRKGKWRLVPPEVEADAEG